MAGDRGSVPKEGPQLGNAYKESNGHVLQCCVRLSSVVCDVMYSG